MSRYRKQTLQRLRNRIDITQLITILDIPWKISEGYFRFLCPLCSEFQTACYPKTNLARCFRCQQNFNPIDLSTFRALPDLYNKFKFYPIQAELWPEIDTYTSGPCPIFTEESRLIRSSTYCGLRKSVASRRLAVWKAWTL